MLRRFFLNKSMQNIIFSDKDSSSSRETNFLSSKRNLKSFDPSIKGSFFSRTVSVPKSFVGLRIFFHNGKNLSSLKVTSFMIGYKLSEFAFLKPIKSAKLKSTAIPLTAANKKVSNKT